jgi:transcription termination factor Rho
VAFASELEGKSLAELHELAAARGVPRFRALRREQLIEALGGGGESHPEIDTLDEALDELEAEDKLEAEDEQESEEFAEADEPEEPEEEAETATGVLEIMPDGFGFLRVEGFGRSRDDVFVTRSQIRALGLRTGDERTGPLRRRRRSERHSSLGEVRMVNGRDADDLQDRPDFAGLTPTHPISPLMVPAGSADLDLRMLDFVAPPVKGARLLISGPPRSGTTTLMRRLLDGVASDGSVIPFVVLVDARPEELADWQRSASYPVYGSAADATADTGVELATVALERARRLVEQGDDVLLAIDSLSRLARTHGLARSRGRGDEPGTGFQFAKRWFAAGRNTEEGGSLTIVATAHAVGLLHEALADVATAEVRLDGDLAAAGNEPPIDVRLSFTRPEALLPGQADALRRLHAAVQPLPVREAWQHVADQVRG